jgi:hypothetical protein
MLARPAGKNSKIAPTKPPIATAQIAQLDARASTLVGSSASPLVTPALARFSLCERQTRLRSGFPQVQDEARSHEWKIRSRRGRSWRGAVRALRVQVDSRLKLLDSHVHSVYRKSVDGKGAAPGCTKTAPKRPFTGRVRQVIWRSHFRRSESASPVPDKPALTPCRRAGASAFAVVPVIHRLRRKVSQIGYGFCEIFRTASPTSSFAHVVAVCVSRPPSCWSCGTPGVAIVGATGDPTAGSLRQRES